MTTERKPFAEVRGRGSVYVAGRFITDEWVRDAAPIVDRINAAVDQREAQLRGALEQALDALDDAHHLQAAGAIGGRDVIDSMADAIRTASAALAGTGPAYVPAAQLEAAEAKVRQLQAALDVLDSHETMTAQMVATYLEASGLRKPVQIPAVTRDAAGVVRLDGFSDATLLNEIRRRGYSEPGVARPARDLDRNLKPEDMEP